MRKTTEMRRPALCYYFTEGVQCTTKAVYELGELGSGLLDWEQSCRRHLAATVDQLAASGRDVTIRLMTPARRR